MSGQDPQSRVGASRPMERPSRHWRNSLKGSPATKTAVRRNPAAAFYDLALSYGYLAPTWGASDAAKKEREVADKRLGYGARSDVVPSRQGDRTSSRTAVG